MKKILILVLGCMVMTTASAGDWIHVNTRQGNYGNINHSYVSPSSQNGNTIKVMEVIENGPRHGNYAQYIMQIDCSDGTVLVASDIDWYDANQNFLESRSPSNPGWHSTANQKDVAVWNYMCR